MPAKYMIEVRNHPASYTVRPALSADAELIYKILCEGFKKYLCYTIYRAPQSTYYVRRLIQSPDHLMRVAGGDEVVGFYQARPDVHSLFLNYIAVSKKAERKGIGSLLLKDLESSAASRKIPCVQLDVFTDNLVARAWYRNHGYEDVSSQRFTEIALNSGRSSRSLTFLAQDVVAALQHEAELGFSSVSCTYRDQQLQIGLIGGTACKLMSPVPSDVLPDVVHDLAFVFRNRHSLILTGALPRTLDCQIINSHEAVRLRKTIRR